MIAFSFSLVLYLGLAMPVARLVPVLFAPWAIGYLVVMRDFQLLNINPKMMTLRILESVDELVVLISQEGKLVYMNKRAVQFFNEAQQKLEELDFNSFYSLSETKSEIFKRRIILHSIDGEGKRRILDMKVYGVTDAFKDPMGFLLIGTEMEILDSLRTSFCLTDREIDVVYCILKGWKTEVIANHLRIAERTVKSHIGSVYSKLEISNRVDLINIVLDGRL